MGHTLTLRSFSASHEIHAAIPIVITSGARMPWVDEEHNRQVDTLRRRHQQALAAGDVAAAAALVDELRRLRAEQARAVMVGGTVRRVWPEPVREAE